MIRYRTHFLLIVILILSCVSVSIGQFSWDTEKISILSKNKSLRYVLEEINKKLNVGFVFDDKLINQKTVTRDVKNKTVEEILKLILPEAGLTFREVQDRRIVLYQPTPQDLRFKVVGRVTDVSTGEPLFFANVFLSGTTMGCATNKYGGYVIDNIPTGPYDLVATMMGYKPLNVSIQLYDEKKKIVHFKLKPKILKGGTISVTAEHIKGWKENLKIFEKYFFGIREFAKECSLVNPEVLDFERSSGHFRAFTQEPATYINNALGYKVTFILIKFDYKLYNGRSGLKGGCIAAGRFEELNSKDEIEEQKWMNNRLITYNGSMHHFIRALWEGQLREEGFTICRLKMRREYSVKADTLLKPSDIPYQYILKPCPDWLKITYENERDDESYKAFKKYFEEAGWDSPRNMLNLRKAYAHQVTSIEVTKPIIITIGPEIVIIPDPPIFNGYWGRYCAPEWLPMDYKPPKKERDK